MSTIDAYQADEGMLANFTERVDGGFFTHEISVVRSDLADAALAEALDLAAHWKSLAKQERTKVRDMEEFLAGMKMPWGGS